MVSYVASICDNSSHRQKSDENVDILPNFRENWLLGENWVTYRDIAKYRSDVIVGNVVLLQKVQEKILRQPTFKKIKKYCRKQKVDLFRAMI